MSYFDGRNPINIQRLYQDDGNGIAPHWPGIERWSYTVPQNRKCMFYSAIVQLVQQDSPSTVGRASIIIELTTNQWATIARATKLDGRVGSYDKDSKGICAFLLPGDRVHSVSSDKSVGGLINYRSSIHGIEFDA